MPSLRHTSKSNVIDLVIEKTDNDIPQSMLSETELFWNFEMSIPSLPESFYSYYYT